jgi:hypothetical protein
MSIRGKIYLTKILFSTTQRGTKIMFRVNGPNVISTAIVGLGHLCGAAVVQLLEDPRQLPVLPAVEVQLAQLGHRLEPQPLVFRVSQRVLRSTPNRGRCYHFGNIIAEKYCLKWRFFTQNTYYMWKNWTKTF